MSEANAPPKMDEGAEVRRPEKPVRDWGKYSLVLGIVGVVMLFIPIAALFSAAVSGLACWAAGYALNLKRRKLRGAPAAGPLPNQSLGKGFAGLVLGLVGVVVWAAVIL